MSKALTIQDDMEDLDLKVEYIEQGAEKILHNEFDALQAAECKVEMAN